MVKFTTKVFIISFFMICSTIFNFAMAKAPTFNCTLSDSEHGDAKSIFTKDTQMVYLTCTSSDVTKGQVIKGTWIATDTKNVAPANYKIDEKGIAVDKDLTKGQEYDAKFSLSRPDKGWPVGDYRVELYADKDLVNTYKFSIN